MLLREISRMNDPTNQQARGVAIEECCVANCHAVRVRKLVSDCLEGLLDVPVRQNIRRLRLSKVTFYVMDELARCAEGSALVKHLFEIPLASTFSVIQGDVKEVDMLFKKPEQDVWK